MILVSTAESRANACLLLLPLHGLLVVLDGLGVRLDNSTGLGSVGQNTTARFVGWDCRCIGLDLVRNVDLDNGLDNGLRIHGLLGKNGHCRVLHSENHVLGRTHGVDSRNLDGSRIGSRSHVLVRRRCNDDTNWVGIVLFHVLHGSLFLVLLFQRGDRLYFSYVGLDAH